MGEAEGVAVADSEGDAEGVAEALAVAVRDARGDALWISNVLEEGGGSGLLRLRTARSQKSCAAETNDTKCSAPGQGG